MSNDRKRGEHDEARHKRILNTFIFAIFVIFATAAIACVVAYIVTRIDVLFIPIALSAVVAMISFTYTRIGRS